MPEHAGAMLDINEVRLHGLVGCSSLLLGFRGWADDLCDLACMGLAVGDLLCAVLPQPKLVGKGF